MLLLPTAERILEVDAASDRIDAVVVQHEVSPFSLFSEEVADVIPFAREASGTPFVVALSDPTTSSNTLDVEAAGARRSRRCCACGDRSSDLVRDAG